MSITIEEFARRLDGLESSLGLAIARGLEQSQELVENAVFENFGRAQTIDGEQWPPRKNPKPQHPLLILSGGLMQAATQTGGNHIGRIVDGDTLEIGVIKGQSGTSLAGAQRHQEGDSPPGILARPFLGWSEALVDGVEDRILESLVNRVAEVFA